MFDDKFGYDEEIPENIRQIFMWLCQDFASLKAMWNFYQGLFGNNEATDLLAYYLTESIRVVEESLRISMVMGICRLNDPSVQQNNQNLSFDILVKKSSEIPGLLDLYDDFSKACKPFVVYRNKRFGHRDLDTALDYEGTILPGIGKKEVRTVLNLASQLLNSVALYYSNKEFHFDVLAIGGADNLLYWFKEGLKSRNLLI